MKVSLHLEWAKKAAKAFKNPHCHALLEEYKRRLVPWAPVGLKNSDASFDPRSALWVCDPAGKMLSSEHLGLELGQLMERGHSHWEIVIGGADGANYDRYPRGVFRWSFGPLTLPHEFAAVVAVEQIYRAFTILKGHPYHHG